ncbi:MAG: Uma2 family endonuclease [Chloroflexota bacterium]|nr:Uma2 family endonuclease [Chloroflexota bacterium]
MTTTLPREPELSILPAKVWPIRIRLPEHWSLSNDCLEELSSLNQDLRLERGHYGELEITVPAGGPSSLIGVEILTEVRIWARAGGGMVQESSVGYDLSDDLSRKPLWGPDVSWITSQQLADAGGAPPIKGFWHLCPAFVVEIRSPNDTLAYQQGRVADWIGFGAQLGWLVDPQSFSVWVYRPDRQSEHLERPAELSGEEVLPGFSFDFTAIWAMLDQAEDPSVS